MTTKALKILTVDDEPLARRIVRRLLKDDPRVQSISEAGDGDEALEIIRKTSPDIVYLDIQMPGCNGFELLEKLRQSELPAMPIIIFVTAFDEYALKAFEFHALDYLLKPFDRNRFKESFGVAVKQIHADNQTDYQQKLLKLIDGLQTQNEYMEWVSIKKDDAISLFKIEEIRWVEAQGNYVLLNLGNKLTHLLREKMDSLEEKLDPQRFVRIHRSAIININFIKEIEVWGRGELKVAMAENKTFSVSRNYRNNLDNFLKKVL
jgi:two-component system, LytTR family, response regulator